MFAVLATICFGVAFVLGGAASRTSVWFTPQQFAYLGGACLALHLIGVGVSWTRRPPQ